MNKNILFERIPVGELETNCYVCADALSKQGYVIDPGGEEQRIRKFLTRHSIILQGVINTHGHFDHIRADHVFNVPVSVHRLDEPLLRDPAKNFSYMFPPVYSYTGTVNILEDGSVLPMGDFSIKVLHTPGHTPGGICLLFDAVLISGDTLFQHSVGRTDFSGADHRALMASIRKKLLVLPVETEVYPGHGGPTTIGDELKNNPFIVDR